MDETVTKPAPRATATAEDTLKTASGSEINRQPQETDGFTLVIDALKLVKNRNAGIKEYVTFGTTATGPRSSACGSRPLRAAYRRTRRGLALRRPG